MKILVLALMTVTLFAAAGCRPDATTTDRPATTTEPAATGDRAADPADPAADETRGTDDLPRGVEEKPADELPKVDSEDNEEQA